LGDWPLAKEQSVDYNCDTKMHVIKTSNIFPSIQTLRRELLLTKTPGKSFEEWPEVI
jgi:hypothetical protein